LFLWCASILKRLKKNYPNATILVTFLEAAWNLVAAFLKEVSLIALLSPFISFQFL